MADTDIPVRLAPSFAAAVGLLIADGCDPADAGQIAGLVRGVPRSEDV